MHFALSFWCLSRLQLIQPWKCLSFLFHQTHSNSEMLFLLAFEFNQSNGRVYWKVLVIRESIHSINGRVEHNWLEQKPNVRRSKAKVLFSCGIQKIKLFWTEGSLLGESKLMMSHVISISICWKIFSLKRKLRNVKKTNNFSQQTEQKKSSLYCQWTYCTFISTISRF